MTEPLPPLAKYLSKLRQDRGLSLRQVERAVGGEISNVYLSQLETGKRLDPNPRVLVTLARLYDVPARILFEQAGYIESPSSDEIDRAFRQVLADPAFQFGTHFPGDLDDSAKRTIIQLYQQATHIELLKNGAEAS